MPLDSEILAKIASSIISAIIGGTFKIYSDRKSKLVSFYGHVSAFHLTDQQKTTINTHSVIVVNAGRKTAIDVRLPHNFLPDSITINPPINHQIERRPDGSGDIIFPALVPKEQVTVSYLYFPPLTWNQINLPPKSEDGFAKVIDVIPYPRPNKILTVLIWFLAFIGTSQVFYWLIRLIF